MNDIKHALAVLGEVDAFNAKFAGIRKGEDRESLSLGFWSRAEIEESLDLRSDWEIPATWIPFYGDWHDLYCFDVVNGTVLEIDDSRATTFSWPSFAEFQNSMIKEADWEDLPSSEYPKPVSVRLDL